MTLSGAAGKVPVGPLRREGLEYGCQMCIRDRATSARQVILQAAETLRKNYQKELCLADLLA